MRSSLDPNQPPPRGAIEESVMRERRMLLDRVDPQVAMVAIVTPAVWISFLYLLIFR